MTTINIVILLAWITWAAALLFVIHQTIKSFDKTLKELDDIIKKYKNEIKIHLF